VRDLIEAGLNEPRVAGSGYGDCVAAPIPTGDGARPRDGLWPMDRGLWRCLERFIVVAVRSVGSGGARNGAVSGVSRRVCTARFPTPGDGITAALVRSFPAPGSVLMIHPTRMVVVAGPLGAAEWR
jgi:hypothetical protein